MKRTNKNNKTAIGKERKPAVQVLSFGTQKESLKKCVEMNERRKKPPNVFHFFMTFKNVFY